MKATPSGETFTVFIVDDDEGVVRGLSQLLRAHGYETQSFASSEEFLQKHDRSLPGCALLDLSVPGLELQQAFARNDGGGRRPIIFLTGRADILSSVRAIKAGAVDILTKPVDDGALLAAIAQAEQLDADQRRESAELLSIEKRLSNLTRREREVLRYVVAGRKSKQIANELGTVEQTIKVHRARMMTKLKVRSISELVRLAERAGVSMATQAPKPSAIHFDANGPARGCGTDDISNLRDWDADHPYRESNKAPDFSEPRAPVSSERI